MKLYAFIFMGDYLPEHTATFEHAGTRTSIYTVGSFEEAKPLVEHQEGRPERPRLGAAALRAEKGGKDSAKGNVS